MNWYAVIISRLEQNDLHSTGINLVYSFPCWRFQRYAGDKQQYETVKILFIDVYTSHKVSMSYPICKLGNFQSYNGTRRENKNKSEEYGSIIHVICDLWYYYGDLVLSQSLQPMTVQLSMKAALPWASYYICKIVGCVCAGNAGSEFPVTDFRGNRWSAIPACITARARRTCRDACRDCLTRGGAENIPGIPGTCATRRFTYLVRGVLAYCMGWIVKRKLTIKHPTPEPHIDITQGNAAFSVASPAAMSSAVARLDVSIPQLENDLIYFCLTAPWNYVYPVQYRQPNATGSRGGAHCTLTLLDVLYP